MTTTHDDDDQARMVTKGLPASSRTAPADEADAKTYRCARCGEMFTTEWSDAEAQAEARANFGSTPGRMAVICEDCYQLFMTWYGPIKN